MKRFLKVLAVVVFVVVFALALARVVDALFSAMVKGSANRLQAGTVEVEVIGDPVNLSDISPGSQGEALFEVHNVGTLPVTYTVNWETSGALFEGANPIELWSLERGRLGVGEVAYIGVTWNFPAEAGNEYQGASGLFTLVVNAQQDVGGYPVHGD
jgi:spore coat-associated protein N